ncbi:hypothetical protein K505DRAFT_36781 [Melanomma pulvis-pyrius CBS 109.77]|uniref:Uncharacterized protein n=1 Tax=Melanomma pulvis-pyrius CBS 109.77 TaxID=1314802 RepID=A0A6A6XUT0_9PLEO|nr:hypothetical protein K505DRAFT_36781 [Melanomma pulvis-pyrius CBS 109.77]
MCHVRSSPVQSEFPGHNNPPCGSIRFPAIIINAKPKFDETPLARRHECAHLPGTPNVSRTRLTPPNTTKHRKLHPSPSSSSPRRTLKPTL